MKFDGSRIAITPFEGVAPCKRCGAIKDRRRGQRTSTTGNGSSAWQGIAVGESGAA